MKRYDPKQIEPKWQQTWEETGLYRATEDPTRRAGKRYVLDMFPYPSGAGLHVGHVRNFSISDVYARFLSMQGHQVMHPMGWDAFGLPAENYAIKTGTSPDQSTKANTDNFRRQMKSLGFAYDWSREINSSSPDYYKWTQWFFLFLYERGLAYQAESLQWWCEHDQTVLANEQVENGRCWRCGHPVTKKSLKQWFFKITDYADRLLADLDDLDWPEKIKLMQRNWIGRSVGAEIEFTLSGIAQNDDKKSVTVFTTRPDTLGGATFLVVSPELAQAWIKAGWKAPQTVYHYIEGALRRSEIERQDTDRSKTGVNSGITALNPLTKQEIPVWVADYVLGGYGTGAIMAVPAHDQRDFEFASKFNLPIAEVVEPITGTPQENPEFRRSIVAVVEDPKTGDVLSINWGTKLGGNLFIGGGLEGDEDPVGAAKREIAEETGYANVELVEQTGKIHHHYFAHSKNQARQIEAVGLHFRLKDQTRSDQALEADEQGKFTVEWLTPAIAEQRVTDPLHQRVFQQLIKGQVYTGEGMMVNSGEFDGLSSAEAREQITERIGAEKVNYKLRDWLISRQRYWGAPIPIIHCEDCGTVPVPKDQLPVELPEVKSYEPSGDGRSPLAHAADWVNVTCPKCGGPGLRETDTMDTFACSSWYFLRFADPHNNEEPFARDKIKYWEPVDMYVGGAEHAVLHLLYARFWVKAMQDAGLVPFKEPFTRLRNQGLILAADGRKMSKSFGNVIDPMDLINEGYGADALRMYELFIGPYDQAVAWNHTGIDGTKRFLNRVFALVQDHLEARQANKPQEDTGTDQALETALAKTTHKTIKRVTFGLEQFGFNTAIAAQMEAVNELYKLKTRLPLGSDAWHQNLKLLVQILAPFAPHVTEELWHDLGGETTSVHAAGWPTFDEALAQDELLTVVVQVNGKLRGQLEVAAGVDENEIKRLAMNLENVQNHLNGKNVAKEIYVPGKLFNFVAK
jgi:leucyl-tRNA synthetase